MSRFPAFLLVFLCFNSLYGLDLPVSRIPDDSLLRINLMENWFLDTPNNVLRRRSMVTNLISGERVEVRTLEGREEFQVILARELYSGRIESGNNPALPRGLTGQYPGWAQGSWILTRNKNTGAPASIRIFLRSDQNMRIEFRPMRNNNERCEMDVIVYGAYLIRSLPIAVPLERLYTMPLNDVLRLAGDRLPLLYFEPDPVYYRDTRNLISQIRAAIRDLKFADDGAIDEHGNFVFIETGRPQNAAAAGLNCSGFVKWLTDGILRPVTGSRLPIAPLKAPFGNRGSSMTELWEESRDPYFGLDWIRNLASIANATLRSPAYGALEEIEVRADNFSQIMVNSGGTFVTQNYPGFLGEAGYGTEGLHALLYTLAVDDPFSFYLAAVNNEVGAPVTPDNPRGSPRLRQYYHVAALFPYFDEYGNFRVAVFESAAETSINDFIRRYPGHNVNLVRVPVAERFDP